MELGSSFNTKDLLQNEQQHERITASDASSRVSATRSVRSARTACNDEEAKFARSPGIKILEMAGKVPEYHSKFSVKEFKLRNQTFVEEGSDEYDTDLESDVVGYLSLHCLVSMDYIVLHFILLTSALI